jgi:hypothetical protein
MVFFFFALPKAIISPCKTPRGSAARAQQRSRLCVVEQVEWISLKSELYKQVKSHGPVRKHFPIGAEARKNIANLAALYYGYKLVSVFILFLF